MAAYPRSAAARADCEPMNLKNLQNGVMDVDEEVADVYQQTLRNAIPQFK